MSNAICIPLTKGQSALLDPEDAELAQFKWSARLSGKTWYAYRRRRTPGHGVVHLHREVARRAGMVIIGVEVDHRDADGLNNRRSNLRPATHANNQQNRGKRSDNTSGRKGVSWCSSRGKWQVHIMADGKRLALGRFNDLEEAARVYRSAAITLHGEFANAS